MNQLGNKIRELRELHNIRQRQIAAYLDTDTAQISKIEKGTRQLKREQVLALATFLHANHDELISLWLADKVYVVISGEPMANEALVTVSSKLMNNK